MFDDVPLLREEPLAKYTAARLGGPAEYLYVARESMDDLVNVLRRAWAADIPVRVLGGGANVLVSDNGVRGLVVINRIAQVQFDAVTSTFKATSGMPLTVLARRCATNALAGFEWAVSVPGTLGGAVVNNAGAHGGDIARDLVEATLVDTTGERTLTNADLAYNYRTSALKGQANRKFFVTGATLKLTHDDQEAINARIEANIAHRKRTQPPGASLGSIFKNPLGDYAGRLIESCGLKWYSIGGAMISPVHANFFINNGGNSTARDYYALIQHAREVVLKQTGVELETEVEVVGEI